MSSPTSKASVDNPTVKSPRQELPLLLRFNSARSRLFTWNKSAASVKNANPSSGTGFYKRLIEWMNQKKKTRRRYSDVPLLTASTLNPGDNFYLKVNVPATRNKSAPMIFDIPPPSQSACTPAASRQSASSTEDSDRVKESNRHEIPRNPTERQSSEETEQENDHEWNIPWADVNFGSPIRKGRTCTISRGQWHGEVIIHEFQLNFSKDVGLFWNEVNSLSKLRHENLLLFMGVAVNRPSYAVINSAPRGVSLTKFRQEKRNGQPDRISLRAAISIGRQVGQAMGYLHARGLVHGKINTENVFLEGDNYRIKLSLLDHGIIDAYMLRSDYGCVSKSFVGYLSPEQVRCMSIEPPLLRFSTTTTKSVDIYSFGSLLYDLIVGYAPFWNEPVHSVLWRIGSGETTSLQSINCSMRLKALIAACWSYDPCKRPDFVEIVRRLQPSALLCKSHSCSEPERLNRVGTCKLAC